MFFVALAKVRFLFYVLFLSKSSSTVLAYGTTKYESFSYTTSPEHLKSFLEHGESIPQTKTIITKFWRDEVLFQTVFVFMTVNIIWFVHVDLLSVLDKKLGDLDVNPHSTSNKLGDLPFIHCSLLCELALSIQRVVALTNLYSTSR